jgi:hypothetical protein
MTHDPQVQRSPITGAYFTPKPRCTAACNGATTTPPAARDGQYAADTLSVKPRTTPH